MKTAHSFVFSNLQKFEQVEVEESIAKIFRTFNLRYQINNNLPKLLRWEHKKFLQGYLSYLPESYQVTLFFLYSILCFFVCLFIEIRCK